MQPLRLAFGRANTGIPCPAGAALIARAMPKGGHMEEVRNPDPWALLDYPLNQGEQLLERLQASWADFAQGCRSDSPVRIVRAPDRAAVKMLSLLTVNEFLRDLHQRFTAGDRSAAWDALVWCASENVPLPYWVGSEVLRIARAVRAVPKTGDKPSNLHDEFGLERTYPARGSRAITARRREQIGVLLYSEVGRLRRRSKPPLTLTDAIHQAIKSLGLGCSFSTARRAYLNRAEEQRRALDLLSNTKRSST